LNHFTRFGSTAGVEWSFLARWRSRQPARDAMDSLAQLAGIHPANASGACAPRRALGRKLRAFLNTSRASG
jgi:hypothetical protein